jgi:DNA-binding NtrC family response regulator
MPGMSGMSLLSEIKKTHPDTDVVVVTAFGSVEQAVDAMKQGVYDYLLKPLNLDELEMIVQRLEEKRSMELSGLLYERRAAAPAGSERIVAASPAMRVIISKIRQVAKSRATVLVTGESGVGKELVSRAIHEQSDRGRSRFVPVNCAALPEGLLESELFGHERGSFTGAYKQKKGYFEIANGGTIFLDEIGEINHATQMKLLRILETREFERVGGTATIRVDVRLIAATNADLGAFVKSGKFRQDLYYRLSVVAIDVPPLRERREDIPALSQQFLNEFAMENAKPGMRFEKEALDALLAHDWPGNVRQLRNTIESLVVMARGTRIRLADLPAEFRQKEPMANVISIPRNTPLHDVEKQVILDTLEAEGGNKTKTAKVLAIGRRTLIRKLQEYGEADAKGSAK